MDSEKSPIEIELLGAIKSAERQRTLFPFVLLGFLLLYIWYAGGELFAGPNMETAYPMITIIALIYLATETLNLKIMLLKAEYRDWIRDYRKERFQS